jgi:hypothetical protein
LIAGQRTERSGLHILLIGWQRRNHRRNDVLRVIGVGICSRARNQSRIRGTARRRSRGDISAEAWRRGNGSGNGRAQRIGIVASRSIDGLLHIRRQFGPSDRRRAE